MKWRPALSGRKPSSPGETCQDHLDYDDHVMVMIMILKIDVQDYFFSCCEVMMMMMMEHNGAGSVVHQNTCTRVQWCNGIKGSCKSCWSKT